MSQHKVISSREMRRGTPEETLASGESLLIKKQGGKVFELRRVDRNDKSLLKQLDQLLDDIPVKGQRVRINLAKIICEERE